MILGVCNVNLSNGHSVKHAQKGGCLSLVLCDAEVTWWRLEWLMTSSQLVFVVPKEGYMKLFRFVIIAIVVLTHCL